VTTHVHPSDGKEQADYHQTYCRVLGELEHLSDLAFTSPGSFGSEEEARRLAAFYQGILGLFDQAWRVERSDTSDPIDPGSLLARTIAYGVECHRLEQGLAQARADGATAP
jgi:hypothetical protein